MISKQSRDFAVFVNVKNGSARNFLLPQGKALRANEQNRTHFESQRAELEARNLERKSEAESVNEKLNGNAYVIIRAASENGQLYGSVSARDIAEILDENGFKLARSQVSLNMPIKLVGLHEVVIALHPEVESRISINVARSEDEAERQAKGEDLTGTVLDQEEEEVEIDLAEVFENPDEVELEPVTEVEEADEVSQDDSQEEASGEVSQEADTSEAEEKPAS